MKKFFALILALVMALSLVACGGGSNGDNGGSDVKAKLRFVTGGESGTYYAFGSVIAQHATNNAGVDVVGLVGNGSQRAGAAGRQRRDGLLPVRRNGLRL